MMYLPANLKKYRILKELTQEDVAEFLGITPQSVSKWERGKSYPDITLVLYNKASSFKDFGVITQISKYKRVRDSICRELLVKEFGKQNGKTIKRKEDNSEKKENNTQNVQPQSEDRTSVNGSSDQKNTPKRPEKRKASGNNAHARESVMSKLREYQKYIEDKKPKAQ